MAVGVKRRTDVVASRKKEREDIVFSAILERLSHRFGPDAIAAYIAHSLPGILSALLVFLVFLFIWWGVSRLIRAVLSRLNIDRTLVSFIETVLRYAILIAGMISALSEIGIDTKALLTSLGVAGLTLGFAAKDTLSNLISGIFIFWDRPFVLGDLVEFGGFYGRIDQITMRSTRLVTVDGKMVAIPNANIVNSPVVSYTNFPHIRLDIEITVGNDADFSQLRQIFLGEVTQDERFLQTPPPIMVVTSINDYNIAVQFRVWLVDEKKHVASRFELRERLYEKFRSEGVDMPLETIRVELDSKAPFEPAPDAPAAVFATPSGG